MSRSLRESTLKKSLNSQSKAALKEINRRKRSSKHLRTLEAIELPSVEVDTSDKDTSGEDRVFIDEEEYWLDPSAFEFTNIELSSPITPFPQPPLVSENWSTSVNRFDLGFSSEGESQVGSTYGSFPLLSPRLEINAVANQVISDVIDHILEESINLVTSSESSQETNKESTMNNADYKAKVMELDDYTVNIESLIARFNKNTVSLLDLATYRQELKDIFDVFSLFERKYLELRGKLDRNSDNDIIRLNQLKELHERTKKRIVDNEVAVKKKLVELQNGNIHATAGDTDRIAKSKVQLKLKHAMDKFKNL